MNSPKPAPLTTPEQIKAQAFIDAHGWHDEPTIPSGDVLRMLMAFGKVAAPLAEPAQRGRCVHCNELPEDHRGLPDSLLCPRDGRMPFSKGEWRTTTYTAPSQPKPLLPTPYSLLPALLLAVGEMADTLLCFDSYVDPDSPGAVFCSRCFVYSLCGQPIEHMPSCLVGRVLELASGVIKSFPEGTFEPDCTLEGLRNTARRNGRHALTGSAPLAEPAQPKKYLDWGHAGGPNECRHGYAEGISCPSCDAAEKAAKEVVAQAAEPAQGEPAFCGVCAGPCKLTVAPSQPKLERRIVYDVVEHPTATELR